MLANREVNIRANLSYVLVESVAEASPSFPYVELRTFAARNDVNHISGRARELVLESQLTARRVESL